MAQSAFGLRRAVASLAAFCHSLSPLPLLNPTTSLKQSQQHSTSLFLTSIVQSRPFISYPKVLLSPSSSKSAAPFDGLDYNHWVIYMDNYEDAAPNEIMVEETLRTYETTCAEGLNISLEEAKQRIYACETDHPFCFQAVMTEEESKKFHGLPGVLQVIPDSYIDPDNKDYGGDKYINGMIIPRPHKQQNKSQGDGVSHGSLQNYPFQENHGTPGQEEKQL